MQAVSSPSLVKNVVIVLVVLVVAYAAIAVLMRVFRTNVNTSRAHMVPLSTKISASDPTQGKTYASSAISPWSQGGEYTITGWFGVTDWNVNSGKYRHLFSLSTPSKVVLYAVIDKEMPTMIVRVRNLSSGPGQTDLTPAGFSDMITNGTDRIDRGTIGIEPCDVGDVDLQRWMMLTLAVRGRMVDIYLDGKLARNCVLPNLPDVDPTSMQLNVGSSPAPGAVAAAGAAATGMPSFGGSISNVQTWNTALAPETIADLYSAGPDARTGGWLSSWLHMFNVTITVADQTGDNKYTLKL